MVDMFVHAQWENDNYMIYSWWLNIYYNMLLCWFLCVVERPTMPTLEDGLRSWPTWLSARSPRNRPQELMRMLETLDSRCWLLLTRLRKPKNLMPKSLTEDLRWWPSSACFSRRGWGSVRILFVTTLQEKKHHKECGWKSATMQSISTTESTSVKKETQLCVNSYGVFWVSEVYFLPATFSEHCMFGFVILFLLLYLHICLPVRWVVECVGNEQFHDVTCTDCTIDTMPSKHAQIHAFYCRFDNFYFVSLTKLYTHCLRLQIISRHIMSNHIISYQIKSYNIISYQIKSYHIVLSHNVIPWLYHIVSRNVTCFF